VNVNKVILVGYLSRSPELRYGTNGTTFATFGMATNRAWTDEQGEKHEEADFHNITVFGRQVDPVVEYLRKGQLAAIEGRIRTRAYGESEGRKLYRTDIIADRVQFGPRRDEAEGETAVMSDKSDVHPYATASDDGVETELTADQNDDIPF
jgi:single-strand DNA-binding protein